MEFSIYSNDNSKLNKIKLEAGKNWSDISKAANNNNLESIWKLVDNGDGKVQQNELELLNKLLKIADNSNGKADNILDNKELSELHVKINEGQTKDLIDTRVFGTVNGKDVKLDNFSYLDKGDDVDMNKLTPTQRRTINRNNRSNTPFVVNVDYSNLDIKKEEEYYIDGYERSKNSDGTYTERPILSKKQDSGQGRSHNWSEGLDRQISKISLANPEVLKTSSNQMSQVIEELRTIGKEVGFEVEEINMKSVPWVEDYGIRRADGKMAIVSDDSADNIKYSNRSELISDRNGISVSQQGKTAQYYKEFQNTVRENDIVQIDSYLEGGNVLNTCLADGTAAAIVGEESINYTIKAMGLKDSPENREKAKVQIAEDLGIKQENLTFIPQYDFHIDMSYRPLYNGEIAIPDYEEGIRLLKETQITGMDDEQKANLIKNLEEINAKSTSIREQAEEALKNSGYKIVKIPCFSDSGDSQINFMNGVGATSKTGQSFYITNKSDYPELNEAIQKYFSNAGVDKVYFVSTQSFLKNFGGIDCITQEV